MALSDDARANIARIQEIWASATSATEGRAVPVRRLRRRGRDVRARGASLPTYAIPVKPEARPYLDAMQSLPAFQDGPATGWPKRSLIERFETCDDGRAPGGARAAAGAALSVGTWAWNSGYAGSHWRARIRPYSAENCKSAYIPCLNVAGILGIAVC